MAEDNQVDETITSDDIIQIAKESALGLKPSITTPAALKLRDKIDAGHQEMIEQGMSIDLPFEMPG